MNKGQAPTTTGVPNITVAHLTNSTDVVRPLSAITHGISTTLPPFLRKRADAIAYEPTSATFVQPCSDPISFEDDNILRLEHDELRFLRFEPSTDLLASTRVGFQAFEPSTKN